MVWSPLPASSDRSPDDCPAGGAEAVTTSAGGSARSATGFTCSGSIGARPIRMAPTPRSRATTVAAALRRATMPTPAGAVAGGAGCDASGGTRLTWTAGGGPPTGG